MLRKWLVLRAPDANTGGDSSTPPDDKGADSSQQSQDANQTADQTDDKLSDDQSGDQQQTDGTGDASSTDANDKTVDQQDADTQSSDDKKFALDKPEDEKLPFHKEPRFQELVQEKNTYKQEVEQLKPLAQRAQVLDSFVAQHNIQPQQLQAALEYCRLLNSEPAKAYEMLRPAYEKLASFVGDRLPADLQERVAAGTLEPELAKELARSRGQQEYQQTRQQMQGQNAETQRTAANTASVTAWANTTMQSDPDFKPKQPGAVDGKWEFVHKELLAKGGVHVFTSPQEALKATQEAYAEANKFFRSFKKPAIVKKPIQSTSNSSNANAVVKTEKDVVAAILAGKKPHQLRYS